ncbi:hypothetical protein RF11_03078 [Thelohanellus kitauei]|uniref:Uncharacterized protein n=1 Tax=Thelohanellus kitauei TaxID=669202 RepID=A0A0C2IWK8_THEKT|nr:hypothetical protein RF11_03078 [Thelohanellus kitauei]
MKLHLLDISFKTFTIQFPKYTQICERPSPKTKKTTRIRFDTTSGDLIYPCKPNDTMTTTQPLTYGSVSIITKTSNKHSSSDSNQNVPSLSYTHKNSPIISKKMWKSRFTGLENEHVTTKSDLNGSKDSIGTNISTLVSEIEKNGSLILEDLNPQTQSVPTPKPFSRQIIESVKSNRIDKIESPRRHEPIYITESEVFEAFHTKLKSSFDIFAMFRSNKFFSIKDILSFSFVIVGIIILVFERRRRRKISRQVKNYLYRAKSVH